MKKFIKAAMLCLVFLGAASITSNAHAGIFDEIEKGVEKVGKLPKKTVKELDRFQERVKREADRFIDDVREEGRRFEERMKKVEREIRRIRDDVKKAVAELPVLGKQVVEVMDEVEELAESSAKQISNNLKIIEQADDIISGNLDEVNISVTSYSQVLGGKLAQKISSDKVEEFLQTEIAGDLRIIHVLMPVQAVREQFDPTGVSKCLRQDSTTRIIDGNYFLQGAPELGAASEEEFAASLEQAAVQITAGCIKKNLLKSEEEQNEFDADKITADAQERKDKAIAERNRKMEEFKASEEEREKSEEYLASLQKNYEENLGYLEILNQFKESNEELKDKMEQNTKKFAEFVAEIDPKLAEELSQFQEDS
ncbi:hypothetical protein [Roseibium sp. MB-4]